MIFVFVLFAACLIVSGVFFRQKDAAVLPVCATVLFLSACVCAGDALRLWSSDAQIEYVFAPFVTVFKQKYYWQMSFDGVSSCAAFFVAAAAFLLTAAVLARKGDFPARNAFYLFGACIGAFLCFGARNVFQFLAGWEIAGVSAGMTAFCFDGAPAAITARRRFRLYGALADAPLYVLLVAACVRGQSYDLAGTQDLSAPLFAVLCGASLLAKMKCLAVLNEAQTPFAPLFFAASVFGAGYAYFFTGFAPAALEFSFEPVFAAIAGLWLLTAGGLLFKRRFGVKGVSRARKKRRMFFAILGRRLAALREKARLESLTPAPARALSAFAREMHARRCPYAAAFLICAAGVAVCLAFAFLLRGDK